MWREVVKENYGACSETQRDVKANSESHTQSHVTSPAVFFGDPLLFLFLSLSDRSLVARSS